MPCYGYPDLPDSAPAAVSLWCTDVYPYVLRLLQITDLSKLEIEIVNSWGTVRNIQNNFRNFQGVKAASCAELYASGFWSAFFSDAGAANKAWNCCGSSQDINGNFWNGGGCLQYFSIFNQQVYVSGPILDYTQAHNLMINCSYINADGDIMPFTVSSDVNMIMSQVLKDLDGLKQTLGLICETTAPPDWTPEANCCGDLETVVNEIKAIFGG